MWPRLLDTLFPPQCGACSAIGSGWCEHCAGETRPVVERRGEMRIRALGTYDGPLRRAILALKDGRRDVAQAFGERLAAFVCAGICVVPVPTTRARRRVRGIDGVVEMARAACLLSGADLREALVHTGEDAQRGRSRSARLCARGRFRATMPVAREVVILDDVCTTGATLLDCAAALREAGATVCEAVVVAVAPNEHQP